VLAKTSSFPLCPGQRPGPPLLRHSTAKMTLDTYTQALSPQKRAAQSKVVGMIRPKPSCTVVVPRVSGEIPVTH